MDTEIDNLHCVRSIFAACRRSPAQSINGLALVERSKFEVISDCNAARLTLRSHPTIGDTIWGSLLAAIDEKGADAEQQLVAMKGTEQNLSSRIKLVSCVEKIVRTSEDLLTRNMEAVKVSWNGFQKRLIDHEVNEEKAKVEREKMLEKDKLERDWRERIRAME